MDETVLNAKKYMDIAASMGVAEAYKALANDLGASADPKPTYDPKSDSVNLAITDIQVEIDGKKETVYVSVKHRSGANTDALVKAFRALINPINHFCIPAFRDHGPAAKPRSLHSENVTRRGVPQEEIRVYLCGPTGVCLSVPRKNTSLLKHHR